MAGISNVWTGNTGRPQYALDLAVAEVVRAGVAVVVAAGNSDTDACLTSPARSVTLLSDEPTP